MKTWSGPSVSSQSFFRLFFRWAWSKSTEKPEKKSGILTDSVSDVVRANPASLSGWFSATIRSAISTGTQPIRTLPGVRSCATSGRKATPASGPVTFWSVTSSDGFTSEIGPATRSGDFVWKNEDKNEYVVLINVRQFMIYRFDLVH